MEGIFDYWQGRQHRKPEKLSPSDIAELVGFLRGEFTYIPSLGSRLENVEKQLLRLTSEQVQIMEALSLNEHLLINGSAGTGKTLLAADFAIKQAEKGKRVLFLTYNKNLANDVKRQVGEKECLKIINLHALFGEYVTVDAKQVKRNAGQYFAEELPGVFYEWLQKLDTQQLAKLQYDLLVMDEGQDIMKPNYLYCLDKLLNGGFDRGCWAVFYDEKQNIYNPEYQDGLDILLSFSNTRFQLFVNCRNTVQIGTYSARASGLEPAAFLRESGEEVHKIVYIDEKDFERKIKDILKELKKEKVQMKDVFFLSPNRYEHSLLFGTGIRVSVLDGNLQEQEECPGYATIQSFKGLDAKIVILFGMENVREELFSKYIYIAGTRARTLLYIAEKQEFWRR